jgi:hypothetical protein
MSHFLHKSHVQQPLLDNLKYNTLLKELQGLPSASNSRSAGEETSFFDETLPNVVFEWLAHLLRIREVSGSNFDQQTAILAQVSCG